MAMILLFTLSACRQKQASDNTEVKTKYSEEEPLFFMSDSCENDDDSHIIYSYNYSGDLISQVDSYVGYYAENGLAVAFDKSTGLVGYIDKDGVYQIEPIYTDAAPFSKDGIAMVKKQVKNNDEDYTNDEKIGYINSKGEEIIPCIYDDATSFFNCGYAIAKRIDYTYDDNGNRLSGKLSYYILDKKGNEIVKKENVYEKANGDEWLDMPTSDENTILAVYKNYYLSNGGIYDYSGKLLYAPEEASNENIRYQLNYDQYNIERIVIELEEDLLSVKSSVTEKFDGEKFINVKELLDYKYYSKRVATTQSGYGYGVEVNGKAVIPFEYDAITRCGTFFIGIKYTGTPTYLNQIIDIYDEEYNKTAENIGYAFRDRGGMCELPNGYFQVIIENSDYEGGVYGIIDYTGKIIVEPKYGNAPIVNSYEGTGVFTIY